MTYSRTIHRVLLATSALAGCGSLPAFAWAADEQPAATPTATETTSGDQDVQQNAGTTGDIIVTARRRAEDIQKIPLSVTALTTQKLEDAGVRTIADLSTIVPGVRLFSSGTSVNTVYTVRGLSRGAVGNEQSAVQVYVNDVPLSPYASNVPTYDLTNVQVLKGPQGTLFGINASAGAILVNTQQPTFDFEGYGKVTVGSYNWNQYEAAVNIPLIDGKLAVRFAGQIARRDGYTKNMSFPGQDFDDVSSNGGRVSVLFTPSDAFKNVFVYEYYSTNTNSSGSVLYSWNDPADNPAFANQVINSIPYTNGTFLSVGPGAPVPCNGLPVCDISAAYARQVEAGPRKAWTPYPTFSNAHLHSITNTTTIDLGFGELKNIFGYRDIYTDTQFNVAGLESPTIFGHNRNTIRQVTDELQLSGKTMNDNLTWIVGGFALASLPGSSRYEGNVTFNPPGTPLLFVGPQPGGGALLGNFGVGNYYRSYNVSGYAQINYQLAGLSESLEGVSIDLGFRQSHDTLKLCTIGNQFLGNGILPENNCTGGSKLRSTSSNFTYTAGLNYQVNNDLLLYAVNRSGYRSGGINNPLFEGTLTPFQFWKPETVNDIELGFKAKWRVGEVFGHLNVAAFRSKYDDVHGSIVTTGVDLTLPGGVSGTGPNRPSAPVPLFYTNIGKARIQGIEFDGSISPMDGLELNAQGAFYSKKVTSVDLATPQNWIDGGIPAYGLTPASFAFFGDPGDTIFQGAPDVSYSFGATYRFTLGENMGDIVLNGQYFRTGAANYGIISAPAWERIDARITWRSVLGRPFDLSVFATNLTDSVGVNGPQSVSPGIGYTSVMYNEPRMIGAELKYSF